MYVYVCVSVCMYVQCVVLVHTKKVRSPLCADYSLRNDVITGDCLLRNTAPRL